MKKRFLDKIICLFIIIIMVVASFFGFASKKVLADNSVAGYITSLAPVITKMPGCKKAIGSGITDLFNGIKSLFSKNSKVAPYTSVDGAIDKMVGKYTSNDVPVADQAMREQIAALQKTADKQAKAQENIDKYQTCLNSIGKAIAKVLINKTTDSIVNWIQTGDSGGPMFVQDLGAFSKSIAEDQILGFGIEINDPVLYPFGKAFMQSQAISFQSKFANNAQYSLDKMIYDSNPNYSAQTFNNDFSQGGWAAWDAMTQNPANNPLGFTLMASNELAKRIEEKTSLAQGSLQMSGGFLGVEKCADPKGVTKEEDYAARRSNNMYEPGTEPRICKTWETVTPGKLVGDMLVSTVQKKDHALMDVETLNDAMAAILDAVLAKFSSSLQSEEGLMSITESNPYEINDSTGFGNSRTEEDYSEGQINASVWLQQNPNFDIRIDLNQAVIDEQRIYQDKIIQQNKELISEVPASVEYPLGNSGLIPTIYQLDYCIPGPHPGWEQDSRDNLDNELSKVVDTTGMDFLQVGSSVRGGDNFGMDLTGLLVVLGVADTGTIDSWAKILGTGQANCGAGASVTECLNRYYYQGALRDFTHIWSSRKSDLFQNYDSFTGIIDRVFSEYVKAINNTYIPEVLPSVTKEAKDKFGKIYGYEQIIKNNEKTIQTLNGTIERLGQIKDEVDRLNQELKDGGIKNPDTLEGVIATDQATQYEKNLIPWKDAFVRLSLSMYSGDDIASADLLTRQIVDERDYVYKNLIQSPTGCETEVENSKSLLPNKYLSGGTMVNRPYYPLPVLYNYPDSATNIRVTRKIELRGANEERDVNRGFLNYGSYRGWQKSDWTSETDRLITVEFCKAYVGFGKSTDAECELDTKGANYLYVTDVVSIADTGQSGPQTGLLWESFENKLGIY